MYSLLLGMALLTAVVVDAPADPPAVDEHGDLFPGQGHVTAAAATGLPFLGIGEVGVGITDGIAVSAVGGITPSVWTVGLRPRFRVRATERNSFELVMPMLFYPKASAPGPFGFDRTSWVLTRAELFFDRALGSRWHAAGGMGLIAAGATKAIANALEGNDFAMPPYDGDPQATKGFAGGIWNTIATRGSYAFGPDTHLFAEASVVLAGLVPADNVGGPPIVVNVGLQHAF